VYGRTPAAGGPAGAAAAAQPARLPRSGRPRRAEAPQLIGGHTVRTYGSHKADGLDTIQLEIALPIRKLQWQREALIEHLAQAIARLVVLWADVHTLPVFHSIDLVSGDVIAGQL